MDFIEPFSCIVFTVLSVGCLIYMVRDGAAAKRHRIYEWLEQVEIRIDTLEDGVLKAERDYWKTKAKGEKDEAISSSDDAV